ncbi:long-chain N-acyl amino acid synthase [Pelomonas sp. APW6]|uniref:Long-chain N-acyl amino acid synthase n=1 Tax=Roseateles subflavus TaxID=3053353 RepID=A0ABT7LRL0_9BURK|nr:long-chain N-acyl amino acid synthase [Pelomonas sp. APW6]MDL5034365.1 long-chain N-acyl amino acid synthase [Pelomonas sp. APW6]
MPAEQVYADSTIDDSEIIDIVLSSSGTRHTRIPHPPTPAGAVGRFQVRVADSYDQRGAASLLIERRYSWRGYDVPGLARERRPNVITLFADSHNGPLGTVTLGLDSETGLLCDKAYPAEVAQLRGPDVRLCEITSLAMDPTDLNKHILASLFHIAYIYARVLNGRTTLLAEVNPRHVPFYVRSLGFELAGPERKCDRANAPAVLLKLSLEHAERQIRRLGGRGGQWPAKSLYAYCFSSQEEEGIVRRIRTLTEAANDAT